MARRRLFILTVAWIACLALLVALGSPSRLPALVLLAAVTIGLERAGRRVDGHDGFNATDVHVRARSLLMIAAILGVYVVIAGWVPLWLLVGLSAFSGITVPDAWTALAKRPPTESLRDPVAARSSR